MYIKDSIGLKILLCKKKKPKGIYLYFFLYLDVKKNS